MGLHFPEMNGTRSKARFLVFVLLVASMNIAVAQSIFGTTSAAAKLDTADDLEVFLLGEKLYGRCVACHAFTYNRTGPKHCGLAGRRAGGVEGFRYSLAMRNSGIVWDKESLDQFLRSPREMVPKTSMGYAGVKKDTDRRALVEYLMIESISAERCGGGQDEP